MGPWYHGQWSSADGTHLGNISFGSNTSIWYENQIEIPFFNHYLKGKNDPSLARATIFFSGENKWRTFDNWPTEKAKMKNLYLGKNGELAWNESTAAGGYDEYISDPAHPVAYTESVHFNRTREYMTDDQRFASRRPDVLTYETPVLTEDLTLGGAVTADLRTSISTTDADFVVKLIDVFPDNFEYAEPSPLGTTGKGYLMNGYQMLVRGEIMRGRYRNSYDKPEAFVPNKPTHVKYALPDVAHTFKKGHRIMVQVQSSWFPLADRNPQQFVDIYHAKKEDFKKASIRIYDNDSKIILPVLK